MRKTVSLRLRPWLLLAGLAAAAGPARADASGDDSSNRAGAATFKTHCASCHGVTARGDGPLADQLRYAPADLTRIARRNRGRFDPEKVFRVIDGRHPTKGHGGTEMPVWGDAFLESREGYDAEKVKQKIGDLVRYLESIQQ
jgi:mono/diheme cytochrome c family protein